MFFTRSLILMLSLVSSIYAFNQGWGLSLGTGTGHDEGWTGVASGKTTPVTASVDFYGSLGLSHTDTTMRKVIDEFLEDFSYKTTLKLEQYTFFGTYRDGTSSEVVSSSDQLDLSLSVALIYNLLSSANGYFLDFGMGMEILLDKAGSQTITTLGNEESIERLDSEQRTFFQIGFGKSYLKWAYRASVSLYEGEKTFYTSSINDEDNIAGRQALNADFSIIYWW